MMTNQPAPLHSSPTPVERIKITRETAFLFEPRQFYPRGPVTDFSMIVEPRSGLIGPSTAVASIGSCFAERIKQWLIARGYNYVQVESGPCTENGSARFGNVYNSSCLRQILASAFGRFRPIERFWQYEGRLLDPYRKNVGWPDQSAAEQELREHARAIRNMLETADVLICTLGLAEIWRNREDGAVFFQVPPKQAFDPQRHEHVLMTPEAVLHDLQCVLGMVREANPKLQMILSLSPVPLAATFRDMSCVIADSVSKAVLRVAIDRFCTANPEVIYFPAYEMVRTLAADPFEIDNRHVRPEIVDQIMRAFMTAFGDEAAWGHSMNRASVA